MARMPIDRDAWAIAFGLNARGATGIILAGVGLAAGVIDDRIFVAIVVMALVTSILAGPMMNWLLSDRIAEAPRGRQASSRRGGLVFGRNALHPREFQRPTTPTCSRLGRALRAGAASLSNLVSTRPSRAAAARRSVRNTA